MLTAAHNLGAQPVSRHILAFYDSGRGQTTRYNHIHTNAEVILNHLGCFVDYWDLQQGLPDATVMTKYRGIITWFYDNSMPEPERYLEWLGQQIDAGRKFVVLGDLGVSQDSKTGKLTAPEAINEVCQKLGFRIDDSITTDEPLRIEVVFKDPEMVEFERSLDYETNFYTKISLTEPNRSQVYLRLKRTDRRNSESALVFTTPNGGFSAASYVVYENAHTNNRQWRLNPFEFFEEAFQLEGTPRPDVTTLNGLRIWCSHIDGDALISKSEVKPNSYCGEIIRDEIIAKYTWPISVSVVVSEIEQGQRFVDIAKSIFRLDWVEAASHSYAHPFYWSEDYRNKEKYEHRHLQVPGYTFDLEKEIIGSVKYIDETLLPRGKRVETFFWTGNCEPQAEALALCEKIGILNTNGGDTIFDNTYNSYTSVAPLGVVVGDYWQVYSPNTNENVYTNDWSGPYFAFRFVLETFKNTESPVRIKPINIYYHFYSGEKWAALNALKEVVETTVAQDVAPMFLSDYVQMVHGFRSAQIEQMGLNKWRVSNHGACTTVRFDGTTLTPDLTASSGVLGFSRYQGSLYLHLDNGQEAIIALTDAEPEMVYLEQGSHRLTDWTASKKQVTFATDGFGKGTFVVANLKNHARYSVIVKPLDRGSETRKVRTVAHTDASGRLKILQDIRGPIQITMTLMRSDI